MWLTTPRTFAIGDDGGDITRLLIVDKLLLRLKKAPPWPPPTGTGGAGIGPPPKGFGGAPALEGDIGKLW